MLKHTVIRTCPHLRVHSVSGKSRVAEYLTVIPCSHPVRGEAQSKRNRCAPVCNPALGKVVIQQLRAAQRAAE